MMNKIKLFVFSMMLLIFPITAHALSGGLTLDCPTDGATPGANIECTVKGTSDDYVNGVEAKVVIEGSATVSSFTIANDVWENGGLKNDNATLHAYIKDAGTLKGSFNVGKLVIKVNDNATEGSINISLTNPKFVDNNNFSEITENITGGSAKLDVTVYQSAVKTGLDNLECRSGGTLSPQFNPLKYKYVIILESEGTKTFAIRATKSNSNDQIKYINVDTNEELSPDSITFKTANGQPTMYIKITVGTGNNAVDYGITVSKPNSKGGELSSLNVGGKRVTLVTGQFEYTVTLKDVSNYQIQAVPKDIANFTISNSNGVLSSNLSGENQYQIVIDPKDNTSGYYRTNYTITVKKEASSEPTKSPTKAPTQTPPINNNPPTGGASAMIIGIILFISLGVSLYLYRKNIKYYTD